MLKRFKADYSRQTYTRAHPKSKHGNPNIAFQAGWKLVCFAPDGYPVYRRMAWWERLIGPKMEARPSEQDGGWGRVPECLVIPLQYEARHAEAV